MKTFSNFFNKSGKNLLTVGLPLLLAAFIMTSCGYKVGDKGPAGGIVFYDKGSKSEGWRYLEWAPSDIGRAVWAYRNDVNIPGTSTAIGSGKKNTQIIAAALNQLGQTGCAAQLCDEYVFGGKDDWFLPSKDELNLMYDLRERGSGGFSKHEYWSSSQSYSNYAWGQLFANGNQLDNVRTSNYYVRCVRAF